MLFSPARPEQFTKVSDIRYTLHIYHAGVHELVYERVCR